MNEISRKLVELNNQVPEAFDPSIRMTTANQTIEVYQGNFELVLGPKRSLLKGLITFNWLPHQSISFWGEVQIDGGFSTKEYLGDGWSVYLDGINCGNATLTRRSIGTNQILEGICHQFIQGDSSIPVTEVRFSLPNLRGYLGKIARSHDGRKLTNGRLIFEDDNYNITLDKVFDHKEHYKELSEKGGFLIVYGGQITRQKGVICRQEMQDLLNRFQLFLSFLNGRRVALFFLNGRVDGEAVWTDYSSYPCADYRYVPCWSEAVGHLDFSNIWRQFCQLWKRSENQQFLEIAINWYLEANADPGLVEGRLILAQTALELFYNWLVVENRQMITGQDAVDLSAANKIRILLSLLSVETTIPEAFPRLIQYAKNKVDAPEALVGIRNALVHGNKNKRSALANIDTGTRHEALQLGLWYVELATLYVLGYEGNYNSRARIISWKDDGVAVPWARRSP